jgi:hypothetical protein
MELVVSQLLLSGGKHMSNAMSSRVEQNLPIWVEENPPERRIYYSCHSEYWIQPYSIVVTQYSENTAL